MERTGRGKHLLEYWAILRRRRWVVYLGVATVTLVALVGSFLATPLYRATTTIQIDRQNPNILAFREMAPTDYSWAAYADFYQTQYKILASDTVARRAVERLGLATHPLFEGAGRRRGLLATLRALLPGTSRKSQLGPVEIAASRLQAGLEITPIRNSQLVKVSWVSPDPELSAQVANAVAGAFIAFNIESHYTASDQATEFLVNQIGAIGKEITAIEDRLQTYGESKQIVSIDQAGNLTLKALSDISESRTAAQTVLAQKQAAYTAVSSSPPEALPEVLHSDLIARLKQEYATYEAQYSQQSRLFKDEWPGMQTLKSRLEQARTRLDLETQQITRQVTAVLESEYRKAATEVRNLDVLLKRQEEAAQHLKRDAVEYANLQSEVQRKRETSNALLTRQNEMALSTRLKDLDATSSNVRWVDQARPPSGPFRPNKKLNLGLGLLVGLALGVVSALFLDYLDNTINSPSEIEPIVHLPVLAAIPRHGATSTSLTRVRHKETQPRAVPVVDLVAHHDPRAEASEAYCDLRTSILLSNAGHPPRQIMITSALPEEGKSATAVNLGAVLAQAGRRVLLVDTDLRRPRLHRVFGRENGPGMSTYLSGLADDPLRLVMSTGIERLDLIPSGPIPPNPSELLNSPGFAAMGKKLLAAGYDHVVYDSPPALSVSDPVIIASVVEAAILVVRAARTPKESLRLAAEKFLHAGIRPIGVVLNDLDLLHQGYSHYRYYGRYHRAEDPKDTEEGGRVRGARRA